MLTRFLALLSVFFALPSIAGPPLNSQENWVVAGFESAPTVVQVDVVNLSLGTTVGDDLATTQVVVDLLESIYHKFDLATVTGYPGGCTPGTYLITFIPDSANCSEAGTPGTCASQVVQVGGDSCLDVAVAARSEDDTYTAVVVSAQGVTQTVLNFFQQRGALPILWREVDRSSTYDFASPDTTIWDVYFYTETSDSPRVLCVVETTSDPSSSLPSSAHCT